MPIDAELFRDLAKGLVAQHRLNKKLRNASANLNQVLSSPELADATDQEKFYVQQRFLGLEIEAETFTEN